MTDNAHGVPGLPQISLVDQQGNPTDPWYSFFVNLWQRTGGALGSPSIVLDGITSNPGSMLLRAAKAWIGLAPGAKYRVLRMGAQFPQWDQLDGNSFGSQSKSRFFASPAAIDGIPVFRLLASSDLLPAAGQFPAAADASDANAGNVGEYVEQQAGPVALLSTVTKNIVSLALTAGDWDVWGNLTSAPDVTTTQSDIRAWISTASAIDPGAPNRGAYTEMQLPIPAGLKQTLPIGSIRVKVASPGPETVYLSANATFSISTLSASGFLAARRRR